MRVGIVGSNGYLGSSLKQALEDRKIEIVKLEREFFVGDSLPKLDLVIDAGFPRDIYVEKVAVGYYRSLELRLQYCRKLRIQYLYIGSLSSHSPMASIYGTAKRKSEECVLLYGGKILRAGLIVDSKLPGGRYLELLTILERLPFVILPNSSYFPIGTSKLEDFLNHTHQMIYMSESNVSEQAVVVEWTNLRDLAIGLTNKKSKTLPKWLTMLMCKLLKVVPLSKLENLKTIAYKVPNGENKIETE